MPAAIPAEPQSEITGLVHIQAILDERDRRYEERYLAQTKAVDAAFLAQQTAMQAALLAAEKAVQTALMAAEKAVSKAEIAAEKRFDSTNEFREQLRDQAAGLMPRAESEARMGALTEKIEKLGNEIDQVASSVRAGVARGAGLSQGWGFLIGAVGLISAVLAIFVH